MKNGTYSQETNIIDLAIIITLLSTSVFFILYALYPPLTLLSFFALVTLFFVLGYLIPKHTNKQIRDQRAAVAKAHEFKKWGFQSRDRNGPWINYIDYPLIKKDKIARGKTFFSERLIIKDGCIIVNPGPSDVNLTANTVKYNNSIRRTYAWDGCSPKIWFYWIFLIGTPDFQHKTEKITILDKSGKHKNKEKIWQLAHHASLVHDALYQYLGVQPISKHEADVLFYEMLIESGMSKNVAKIYHFAVVHQGGKEIDKNFRPSNSDFKNY